MHRNIYLFFGLVTKPSFPLKSDFGPTILSDNNFGSSFCTISNIWFSVSEAVKVVEDVCKSEDEVPGEVGSLDFFTRMELVLVFKLKKEDI